MLDQHEAHDGLNDIGQQKELRDVASDRPHADRPIADREVPLQGLTAATDGAALAINQWLDGDVTESDARRVDSKQVDVWKLIAADTERRKRMVTPSYVAANIMAALPNTRTEAIVATTVVSNTVAIDAGRGVSANMAVAIGVGLFAVGIAIGKLVL